MTFWSSPGQTFLISLFSGEIRAELSLERWRVCRHLLAGDAQLSAIVVIWTGSLIDRVDLKTAFAGDRARSRHRLRHDVVKPLEYPDPADQPVSMLRQLGQGLMFIISSTAMVRYIDEHKGKASALASMGYAVAEAVIAGLAGGVAAVGRLAPELADRRECCWSSSWCQRSCTCCAITERRHRRLRDVQTGAATKPITANAFIRRRQWTRAEVIRDPWYFYLFAPGLMSQPLMFTGFIFHQVHLVESRGWPLIAWASLFSRVRAWYRSPPSSCAAR